MARLNVGISSRSCSVMTICSMSTPAPVNSGRGPACPAAWATTRRYRQRAMVRRRFTPACGFRCRVVLSRPTDVRRAARTPNPAGSFLAVHTVPSRGFMQGSPLANCTRVRGISLEGVFRAASGDSGRTAARCAADARAATCHLSSSLVGSVCPPIWPPGGRCRSRPLVLAAADRRPPRRTGIAAARAPTALPSGEHVCLRIEFDSAATEFVFNVAVDDRPIYDGALLRYARTVTGWASRRPGAIRTRS